MDADRAVTRETVWRLAHGRPSPADADVIVEEPLQIVVDGAPYAVLMRTPGDDIHLAAGFSLAEGLIESAADLGSIQHCDDEDAHRVAVTRTGKAAAPAPRPAAGLPGCARLP